MNPKQLQPTPTLFAFLLFGLPIALVLFPIVMMIGLLVFGLPLLLLTLIAVGASAFIASIASIIIGIFYGTRVEDHPPDPGNYSLNQTKSADEK